MKPDIKQPGNAKEGKKTEEKLNYRTFAPLANTLSNKEAQEMSTPSAQKV